jgi:hypothetical protein
VVNFTHLPLYLWAKVFPVSIEVETGWVPKPAVEALEKGRVSSPYLEDRKDDEL